MDFNSLDYLFFLCLVFVLFWSFNRKASLSARNILLLVASYLFYGWWDPRFLVLIAISSIVDYGVGIALDKNTTNRKGLLVLSIVFNLGFLFTFKYYDFFTESFCVNILGVEDSSQLPLLNFLLPAGISFYTFQSMSYTIDVYRREIPTCRNLPDFFLFVSFFPQLVAGPIEKAKDLLPQLRKKSTFRLGQFKSGVDLIIYGLLKKVLVADQISRIADEAFAANTSLQGNFHLLGAVLFAVQIYCDFSGYSDIAIGSSRLLGIRLSRNFYFPYFTLNPRDFWKRWHISLYNWFRDYLFIPLGGSRVSNPRLLFNIVLVFALSGLWHGANWTFILWGLYNGLLIIMATLFLKKQITTKLGVFLSVFINFVVILPGWMLFRSDNLEQFVSFIQKICFNHWSASVWETYSWVIYLLIAFFLFELFLWKGKRILVRVRKWPLVPSAFRVTVLLLIYLFSANGPKFIYFQF